MKAAAAAFAEIDKVPVDEIPPEKLNKVLELLQVATEDFDKRFYEALKMGEELAEGRNEIEKQKKKIHKLEERLGL